MQGDAKVLEFLNRALKNELTAINQYFLHARMLDNWGLKRLGKVEYEESIDEMKHADKLIERVLFLDGLPNLQRLGKLAVGTTAIEILQNDLALEGTTPPRLNQGIRLCRDVGDNATEDLLTHILVDSEHHVDWLESQLELVRQVGEANYLSQQIRKD